jgi:hypothetical protein
VALCRRLSQIGSNAGRATKCARDACVIVSGYAGAMAGGARGCCKCFAADAIRDNLAVTIDMESDLIPT